MGGEIVEKVVAFLDEIGIATAFAAVAGKSVLPGIAVHDGVIAIDRERLAFPGDLLHEAGHLAVMAPRTRDGSSGRLNAVKAEEIAAIAWSYAASVHLGIDAAVVFHDGGYRGGGASLRDNFTQGYYIGVPVLQWLGMTADAERAAELGVAPYPAMLRWTNEHARELRAPDAEG